MLAFSRKVIVAKLPLLAAIYKGYLSIIYIPLLEHAFISASSTPVSLLLIAEFRDGSYGIHLLLALLVYIVCICVHFVLRVVTEIMIEERFENVKMTFPFCIVHGFFTTTYLYINFTFTV